VHLRQLAAPLLVPAAAAAAHAQGGARLTAATAVDSAIAPGAAHDYTLRLGRGQSADLVVLQQGVDLVVEVRDARDSLVLSVDSPNGRDGEEPVELFAGRAESFRVRIRPYSPQEPAGRYRLRVLALRDARATRALLAARAAARDSATRWLAARGVSLASGGVLPDGPAAPLDALAARARVLGIGEATHGSRELGDLRLSLTRRLVERHGYRVVAIEASESRLALLDRVLRGEAPPADAAALVESGWIGRRTLRELSAWLAAWNRAHPADRVRLVGLDPQDNARARASLHALVEAAYGADVVARLAPVEREMAAADSQAAVFGDSDVDAAARQSLLELVAMLETDAPLLARRVPADVLAAGRSAARQLAQMAVFNGGPGGMVAHSRDWVMAANLLRALEAGAPGTKAVVWAHNAHVAAPADRSVGGRPMGSWLREALGCGYGALAVTFGEGSFVAQVPNDPADRLEVSTLPRSPDESIDAVLAPLSPAGAIAAWACGAEGGGAPAWLRSPRAMHWVGALFTPGTPPSEAFRPFQLLRDFDGVAYLAHVTADELPRDLPRVPPRRR
jgi:erythromycin esterase